MVKRRIFLPLMLMLACFASTGVYAVSVEANVEYENASDYYRRMVTSMQEKHWREACFYGEELVARFPDSPLSFETYFTLGEASFNLASYEKANEFFTSYLKNDPSPKYFQKTLAYKFSIAEAFDKGHKKHLFGVQKLPKLLKGYEDAIALYDEVITTLPRDPLAARSLYQKGMLLLKQEEYTKSIDTLQTLIRRFPRHALTPQAYVGVCQVYATHYENVFADPDYLDLAEINLRKFKFDFPGESRVQECESFILSMKEYLAADLYEIGDFYRRTKKTKAAAIYFSKILKKYPETSFATKAKRFLAKKEFQSALEEVKYEQEEEKQALEKKTLEQRDDSLLVEQYEEMPVIEN
ncbi:hypothetical protein COB21_00605 [Candidatus Aerophobetes bacterium]|uniref:Outer membrane lipoprotein BamD-like domain-containing protein n=1 Tax=Aerophobetes bacterium TaxID=2030807 RepID=A0A2A4X8J0_UNCAE|nr:MAG: hypothetical protein COB21_00605 [Candidatus Aerophobetes bacterium]